MVTMNKKESLVQKMRVTVSCVFFLSSFDTLGVTEMWGFRE